MSKKISTFGLIAGIGALASAVAGYIYYVRPRIVQRWGATEEEAAAALPGDELIPHPRLASTRAITIQAGPEKVWAWLVQIGYGRAGWYSYDALEEAAGVAEFAGGKTSTREILPQFQTLAAGEQILTHAEGGFIVDRAEPAKLLVLRTKINARTGQTADLDQPLEGDVYSSSWAFYLNETEGGTRLVARFRMDYPQVTWMQVVSPAVLEPVVFLMEQKMLKGIKERAEG